MRLAPPSGAPAESPPLWVGPGQTVALAAPDPRPWLGAIRSALHSARLHQPGPGTPEAAPGGMALTVVAFAETPRRRQIGDWLVALEPGLQAGGGAVFIAPRFPDSLPLTRTLPAVKPCALRDDADLPAEFLRAGEWGALLFKPHAPELRGSLRLRLSGAAGEWTSPWWRPPANFAPLRAQLWRAEFAVPCPPGDYRAALESERDGVSPEARLWVKPAGCFPPPHRFEVRWRPVAAASLLPAAAGRLWRAPGEISRQALDLSLESLGEATGWQPLERSPEWDRRRWTGAHAVFLMRATGARLTLRVEDHRRRGDDGAPTVVTLRVDGRVVGRHKLPAPGEYRLEAEWPGDAFAHEVTLDVHPLWVPSEFGGEDWRRLGLLVYEARVTP